MTTASRLRYGAGRLLGLALDVARETVRDLTRAGEVERLCAVVDEARAEAATATWREATVTRERDAARVEVERLGDVVAGLREDLAAAAAARAEWFDRFVEANRERDAARRQSMESLARADRAEAIANEAMREGLRQVEEERREVLFQLEGHRSVMESLREMGAEMFRARAVIKAARSFSAASCQDDHDIAHGALRDALRAFDESDPRP